MGHISFLEWFFLGMPWEWVILTFVFVVIPVSFGLAWDYGRLWWRERRDR